MCVFYLDSTVRVLINWPHELWTEVMICGHIRLLFEPVCSGHTHGYLRPPDLKVISANLALIMTLSDVSHDLLPSIITWDYYMKNLGISFLMLGLLVMVSRRESCWPMRRFYRSRVRLEVYLVNLVRSFRVSFFFSRRLQHFFRFGLHNSSLPCFCIHSQVTPVLES
jgi:hypothetical protein